MADGARKQGGEPTTDLVQSAHVGGNAELFAQIMALHVRPAAKVADVTHGRGVFWRCIPSGTYDLRASDLELDVAEPDPNVDYLDRVDCRSLPYAARHRPALAGAEQRECSWLTCI